MVWAGVDYNGKAPLVFFKDKERMNGKMYLAMLKHKILPWTKEHYKNQKIMQDSAPPHTTKEVRLWISENFSQFITPEITRS
jgi:hypothetical protein